MEREYFVTLMRGKQVAFLLGPFVTHDEALAKVQDGRQLASKADPWTDFDAIGTSSLPAGSGVVGKLNNRSLS